MRCKVWDENKTWYNNLDIPCEMCFDMIQTELDRRECPNTNDICRAGKAVAHKKEIFLCCSSHECRSNNKFVERFSLIKSEIPFLLTFMNELEQKYSKIERDKYSQIVHNLKSLNAQSLSTQSLFIPQDFKQNYRDLFSVVEDKVKLNPKDATITLLKLAKNNNHIKTEFTTHEKLSFENPVLFKQYHNIATVILNVYHSFDMEFREKGINLNLNIGDIYINFDFDTIRVALYHIFSNAIKYMRPKTNLDVLSNIDNSNVDIIFSMTSMHILPDEREKIFENNYSGKQAKSHNMNGLGLGLGYIRKAVSLNNATFKVLAGDISYRANGISYSTNQFVFTFSLI